MYALLYNRQSTNEILKGDQSRKIQFLKNTYQLIGLNLKPIIFRINYKCNC